MEKVKWCRIHVHKHLKAVTVSKSNSKHRNIFLLSILYLQKPAYRIVNITFLHFFTPKQNRFCFMFIKKTSYGLKHIMGSYLKCTNLHIIITSLQKHPHFSPLTMFYESTAAKTHHSYCLLC